MHVHAVFITTFACSYRLVHRSIFTSGRVNLYIAHVKPMSLLKLIIAMMIWMTRSVYIFQFAFQIYQSQKFSLQFRFRDKISNSAQYGIFRVWGEHQVVYGNRT